jgi:hypothetical protein
VLRLFFFGRLEFEKKMKSCVKILGIKTQTQWTHWLGRFFFSPAFPASYVILADFPPFLVLWLVVLGMRIFLGNKKWSRVTAPEIAEPTQCWAGTGCIGFI